jgi:hypothetical protein
MFDTRLIEVLKHNFLYGMIFPVTFLHKSLECLWLCTIKFLFSLLECETLASSDLGLLGPM